MNIQNISALADQLKSLGFENTGYLLLKRICFKPENFSLSQKIEKNKDQLSIQLYFEKDNIQNSYVLMYYDAILQKERALPSSAINGIQSSALEKTMSEIDWKNAIDPDVKKQWTAEDKVSWSEEQKIESIVEDLASLEVTEEGKVVATFLKSKFWAGSQYQELVGNISPLKNMNEVSQRFYFFEGHPGIPVDEAYRFLQNRWLEKLIQRKCKQAEDINIQSNESSDDASSGIGLLRKKRKSNHKVNKGKRPIQNK